jgi:hypothetical protein
MEVKCTRQSVCDAGCKRSLNVDAAAAKARSRGTKFDHAALLYDEVMPGPRGVSARRYL